MYQKINLTKNLTVFTIVLLVTGCSSAGVKKVFDTAMSGTYHVEKLSQTTFGIKYTAGLGDEFQGDAKLEKRWKEKAVEVCGSDDFFYKSERKSSPKMFSATSIERIYYGIAYCNTLFIDSRQIAPDENFSAFINSPEHQFIFRDPTPFWGLLMNQEFDQLNDEVEKLLNAFRGKQINEFELDAHLDAFTRLIPVASGALDNWVAHSPDLAIPYYARARFRLHAAWDVRGNNYVSNTSKSAMDGFINLRKAAVQDIEKALELATELPSITALAIDIYMTSTNDRDKLEAVFERAQKETPNSLLVHSRYFYSKTPRWGGSDEQLKEFVEHSSRVSPTLMSLKALYLGEEARQLNIDKKAGDAIEKYNEAINIASFPILYLWRGWVHLDENQLVSAVESFRAASLIDPYNAEAYVGLTRALSAQSDYGNALFASMPLTALSTQDVSYFLIQGDLFSVVRRYADALEQYQKAEKLLPQRNSALMHKIRNLEFQIEVRKEEQEAAPPISI